MRAVLWTAYGPPDVLKLGEAATPTPKANQVRIKIRATSVTMGDCEARAFKFPPLFWLPLRLFMGVTRPRIKILGQELAGDIESVGQNVTRFKVGDPVFAPTEITFGAYAEYICLPTDYAIGRKPANLTYEQAAAVPVGGLNAVHFLRRANLQAGQHVLIIGAGGTIGTFGVQLAKYYGAHVTAVDRAEKLDMLRSIGADHVIDYTRQDFTTLPETYDVIFDIVGTDSLSRNLKSLKPEGHYHIANPRLSNLMPLLRDRLTGTKKISASAADYSADDLAFLQARLDAGDLTPVIDRTYTLAQIIDAHRYVESGQKKGSVAITVSP
jgi:NADPH:quinone reductase-like Zn-dependent oxidoreductase